MSNHCHCCPDGTCGHCVCHERGYDGQGAPIYEWQIGDNDG